MSTKWHERWAVLAPLILASLATGLIGLFAYLFTVCLRHEQSLPDKLFALLKPGHIYTIHQKTGSGTWVVNSDQYVTQTSCGTMTLYSVELTDPKERRR